MRYQRGEELWAQFLSEPSGGSDFAGALATAVSASAKDYKIGYSVFWGTNPFLVTMVKGARKAVDEWKAKDLEDRIVRVLAHAAQDPTP